MTGHRPAARPRSSHCVYVPSRREQHDSSSSSARPFILVEKPNDSGICRLSIQFIAVSAPDASEMLVRALAALANPSRPVSTGLAQNRCSNTPTGIIKRGTMLDSRVLFRHRAAHARALPVLRFWSPVTIPLDTSVCLDGRTCLPKTPVSLPDPRSRAFQPRHTTIYCSVEHSYFRRIRQQLCIRSAGRC